MQRCNQNSFLAGVHDKIRVHKTLSGLQRLGFRLGLRSNCTHTFNGTADLKCLIFSKLRGQQLLSPFNLAPEFQS